MLASLLAQLRRARGLTQEQLGEAIGAGQTGVSNIECRRQGVSAPTLSRWLDAVSASDKDRLEALRLASAEGQSSGLQGAA